jgi:hypothetical protein
MAAIRADELCRDVELSIRRRSEQPSLVMPDGPLVFPAAASGDMTLGLFVAEFQGLGASVRADLTDSLPPILDDIEAMEHRLSGLLLK